MKKKLLKKLWLWWINYDTGQELRGTNILEQVENVLFKGKEENPNLITLTKK